VANKIDIPEARANAELLAARLPETFRPLVPISAATGEGVRALVLRTGALLDRLGPANQENAAERF
jgi:hypothetical protein